MSPPASSEPALVPGPSSARSLKAAVGQVATIVGYEARKLRHDPTELLLRAVQPALWLAVFGSVFSANHVINTGSLSYLEFLTPGVLAQSVLFIAIFYGIASIRERELGIIIKFLVSPAHRTILVGGRALSASLRGLSQALVVLILATALSVHLNFGPLNLLGVVVTVVLGSALFSTLSMVIASVVRTQERFLGIGQLLTMPLFFASNAIYPLSIMPPWLRPFALANPLTYFVDALRCLMLPAGSALFPLWLDLSVLLGTTLGLIGLAAALYPRLAQ